MDFSSLDLLASTALRDNNPAHADASSAPAEPHHPQQNHHDSVENQNDEDDDDEADGNKDRVNTVDTVATEGANNSPPGEMGSVKCGKHKKNSAKPMSIFVRDGKCVVRHVSSDKEYNKETGGEAQGVSTVMGGTEVNGAEQEGASSPQNITVHCAVSPQSPAQTEEAGLASAIAVQSACNGISTASHPNVSDDGCLQPAVEVKRNVVKSPVQNSETPLAFCDSKTGDDTNSSQEPEMDVSFGQSVERGSHASQESEAGSSGSSSTAFSAAAVLAEEVRDGDSATHEQQERQSQSSDRSHKETGSSCMHDSGSYICHKDTANTHTHTDKPSADVLTCAYLQKGTDPDGSPSDTVNVALHDGVDGEKSLCLVSKVSETALESRISKICDEDLAVASCSQTEVKAGEQNSLCTLSVDQDTGSLGSKVSQSTTCTVQCEANRLLSPPPPPPPPVVTASLALLDHTYSVRHKGRLLDNPDDSGDAFESADENMSADETERRPRSLSVDSVYLQYNLTGLPGQQEVLSQNDKLALLSPTLSVDSISNDSSQSEHSTAAGGQSYSILMGSPTPKGTGTRPGLAVMESQGLTGERSAAGSDGACRMAASMLEAGPNSSLLDSSSLIAVGPKCGKFRIGTFGSFSNSHLDLEKESKKKLKNLNGLSSDPVMKTSMSSPALAFPGSPFPLLQSPGMEWDRSDAGSEAPDDLDSSTTEDKFLSSSHDSEAFSTTVSQVWRHPVFHDHDYCSKEVSEEYLGKPVVPSTQLKTGKRKYVKKKDRLHAEEEKLKKGKYLKRELLKQDNRFNLAAGQGMDSRAVAPKSSLLTESLTTKPNPVGRPRKRTEKQLEEYDAETGTKMKITGKYQDQYVYYLNKSSRNRRRKVDENMPPGDKIILPAPKPGDIVVPHLSDADCEAIRHGGRMALLNNHPHPVSSVHLPHTDSGDMDSSIVNTILSMETEHGSNLHSPLGAYDGVGSGEDFADIEGNLTSEQVKLLFDCLEECPIEETTTSQELDLFTSADAVSVTSTTVDSLAGTSVGDDLMEPNVVQSPSSTGITGPSGSWCVLSKADPGSPAHWKLEQASLEMKTDMDHTETKPLVRSMPVPPTNQPSVEKNLEFLKTPFFPVSSDSSSGPGLFAPAPPTSLIGPLPDNKSDDVNDTPWIVTVTLYWNDIPAIVINNVPHVRLVDIHRQILPAKDTGILKKRCQLMNIQVSNCSEMQRYFLVQYGRAHNSKSTLVISKDEAQRLITYYAHPPPRNLRGEDGLGLRRSSSYAELRSIMERPSTAGRHPTVAFNQPRKRGGFRRRPLPTRSHNPSPEPVTPSVTPDMDTLLPPTSQPAAPPASPAKGLRHKKINFREMLKGEDGSSQLSPLADGMDEDSSAVDDAPVVKGRGVKASSSAGGKKRKGTKETTGAPPAKRGRKPWRKNGKEGSQDVPKKAAENETVESKDSSSTVVGTKKKRSPGTAAGGTLSASGRSPKSKYGPIKVNVKSLVSSGGSLSLDGSQPRKKNLFGRKSSSSTDVVVDVPEEPAPCSNPQRVLRISHQDVEAAAPPTPLILSPTAEVHLDLYKHASSACVKCGTCHKFLSVADFLKHQHMNGGEEDAVAGPNNLDTGHQRRILVPRNKENISLDEQRLWNEFVALQESLDHAVGVASMGAYPLTPLSPASPVGSSLNTFGEMHCPALEESSLSTMTPESPHSTSLHNGHYSATLDAEVAPQSVPVIEGKCVVPTDGDHCSASDPSVGDLSFSADAAPYPWDSQLPTFFPLPVTHTPNEEKCLDNNLDSTDKGIQPDPKSVISCTNNKKSWSLQRPRRIFPTTNIRTSSRKRETKRLYSFEKYEFGVGGKKSGREETDTQDFEDGLPEEMLADMSRAVLENTMHHLTSVTALHETHNA